MKTREIKFRFVGKNNSDDIRYFSLEEIMEGISNIHFNDFHKNEYTGLKDQNGNEIYEGDIVGLNSGGIYEIVFNNGMFVIDFCFVYDLVEEMQVIGNIYKNPGLLDSLFI